MILTTLFTRYPALLACEGEIRATLAALISLYEGGGKLLLCGNGGSCADCDHIVGELCKGFLKMRPLTEAQKAAMKERSPSLSEETLSRLQGALPAVSLPAVTALNTAFSNDVDPDLIYAQGVLALGREGDCLLALSTSGNSKNVVEAARVARALGIKVIALTGEGGGALASIADICIRVPERETYKIQELHLPVYHALCAAVEEKLFI